MSSSPPPPNVAADGGSTVPVAEVELLLGYEFRDPRLLEEALTHPSYYPSGGGGPSYQRLEFVGDAALGLALSNHLFLSHPSFGPGRLSATRAANVSTEKLARAAVRHRLFRFLRHNSPNLAHTVGEFTRAVAKEAEEEESGGDFTYGGAIKAPKVLADIVESIAAAIYIDCGFNLDTLWMVLRKLLEPIIAPEGEQPVSALYELCQKNGWMVDFRNWKTGNVNIANVFVDGRLLGSSTSEQKGVARLNAARDALENLLAAEPAEGMEVDMIGSIATDEVVDEIEGCKQRLHDLCSKNHWPKPVYKIEREDGRAHEKKFICSVQVETSKDMYVALGDRRSRVRDAENAAALRVLQEMSGMTS